MIRHSPSRNQRSKGIKIKQVLQICVLIAICLWLIYQVKHSHDKKKEFEANDAKNTINTNRGKEISKLGRKDLLPQVEEEARTEIEKHDDEEEVDEEKEEEIKIEEKDEHEEEIKNEEKDEQEDEIKNEDKDEQEEEIKNEEKDDQEEEMKNEDKDEQEDEIKNEEKDEQEEEIKTEEREDEERESGNDGIDEHDEEKPEQGEGIVDEEKETEEGEVREGEIKEGEENKDVLAENEVSLVDRDRDEGNENTHEAREEQYKADDASSAVTHDENENGNGEVNILEQENKVNNTEEINAGRNRTVAELENSQPGENGTSVIMGSTDVQELSNNSTEQVMGSTDIQELSNNSTEQGNNTNVVTDNNQYYSNSTAENSEESVNVSMNSEFVVSENITSSNEYDEGENKEGSSKDESLETNSKSEDAGQIQDDPVDSTDSSLPLEEKEMRTDLDTLPEIRTEGTNSEYAAAE